MLFDRTDRFRPDSPLQFTEATRAIEAFGHIAEVITPPPALEMPPKPMRLEKRLMPTAARDPNALMKTGSFEDAGGNAQAILDATHAWEHSRNKMIDRIGSVDPSSADAPPLS